MHDLLRKIGLPATAAAVIAALVLVAPLLFQLDGRYAKHDELRKLEVANEALRQELAQSVGFQQAMVALLQQQNHATRASFDSTTIQSGFITVQFRPSLAASSAAAAASSASTPSSAPTDLKKQRLSLDEISRGLRAQQERLSNRNFYKN